MGTSNSAELRTRAAQREATAALDRLRTETDAILDALTKPPEPQPEYTI